MTSLVFPRLETGALSQFPIRKKRRMRTVTNRSADGSEIKLADPAGVITEWNLTYTDLNDQEAGALQAFFESAEGSLNGFTFLDPAGNLLAWSDEFENAVWQKDPLLTVTSGILDPRGGIQAWRVVNTAQAGQTVAQTIVVPTSYPYCLSAYLRATVSTSVRLGVGDQSNSQGVSSSWSRAVLTCTAATDATSLRFGIEIPALGIVEVYGIQVEAQPGASGYKSTSRGGVYENAHLRDDSLAMTKTGVNRHSCTVTIIHANHL